MVYVCVCICMYTIVYIYIYISICIVLSLFLRGSDVYPEHPKNILTYICRETSSRHVIL